MDEFVSKNEIKHDYWRGFDELYSTAKNLK